LGTSPIKATPPPFVKRFMAKQGSHPLLQKESFSPSKPALCPKTLQNRLDSMKKCQWKGTKGQWKWTKSVWKETKGLEKLTGGQWKSAKGLRKRTKGQWRETKGVWKRTKGVGKKAKG
jgi:hypothetical protein